MTRHSMLILAAVSIAAGSARGADVERKSSKNPIAKPAMKWVGVDPAKVMGGEVPVLEKLAETGLKIRVTVDPKLSNVPLLF